MEVIAARRGYHYPAGWQCFLRAKTEAVHQVCRGMLSEKNVEIIRWENVNLKENKRLGGMIV